MVSSFSDIIGRGKLLIRLGLMPLANDEDDEGEKSDWFLSVWFSMCQEKILACITSFSRSRRNIDTPSIRTTLCDIGTYQRSNRGERMMMKKTSSWRWNEMKMWTEIEDSYLCLVYSQAVHPPPSQAYLSPLWRSNPRDRRTCLLSLAGQFAHHKEGTFYTSLY